ncbi:alpha/beta hydrolase, partial [Arthrobacter bambusae]|uniref:alpha/beta fold hydrolase n=1 Tax=Arthrobacter bambusae TaxID=1338426 RepID=UPI001F5124F2
MILLHDGAWGGSSLVSWAGCIDRLATRFRVILPDFLGFGASDKLTYFDRAQFEPRVTQIEDVVHALGIEEPVHVVGTSFGGSVALRLAAQSAIPLLSATSIGGPGGFARTPLMNEELSHWDGTRYDLARVLRLLMDGEDFAAQLDSRFSSASVAGHYRAVASASLPIPEALRARSAIEPDPWPAQLGECSVPINLIRGERDQLLEPDWADRIASIAPQTEIVVMDALHSPNLDHPHEIVDVLESLLADRGGEPDKASRGSSA